MRFTHLMLAAWCVAVLCICLCDMGGATAQLEGQEKPAIKTSYTQATYGGTCTNDLTTISFSTGTLSCISYNGQTAPGSEFSRYSRCFSSSNGLMMSDGSSVTAICAHVHCDKDTQTYTLEIKNGKKNAPCPAGTTVALSSYSSLFTSGSVTCRPYSDVCGLGPTPSDAAPKSTPFFSTLLVIIIGMLVIICTYTLA